MREISRDHYSRGTILLGEKVMISDPCYSPDTWCQTTAEIKPGIYNVSQWVPDDRWDGYILVVTHESIRNTLMPTEEYFNQLGIDAGQVGIYDIEGFANNDRIDEYRAAGVKNYFGEHGMDDRDDLKGWYGYACCDEYEVLPDGVTSCSGYGDGMAKALVHRDRNGTIDAIAVHFGGEEYDEDEE